MWNDGYSKEQPWLNYYTSYERMHCCFGDSGGDGGGGVGGADDESYNTSLKGTATQDTTSDISDVNAEGMNADQAEQVSDAIDRAQREGASLTQQQNIAEGGNRGAAAGYTGDELGAVASANIDEDFFNDKTMGNSSTSGYGGFADPFAFSGYGQTSWESWMNDLGPALSFFGDTFGLGGFVSNAGRVLAEELGLKETTPEKVTNANIDKKPQDYSINREAESPLEKAARAAGVKTADPYRDGIAGPPIEPMSLAEMAAIEPQNIGNPNDNFDRDQETLAGVNVMNMDDFIQQPGYGGASLGGMTDAELQAAYAEEGRNISSAVQPDVQGLRSIEVDSAEDVPKKIIEKPPEEKAVVPKTNMEKYFLAKRGTPAIPSSFQESRSYLPPIEPAANADYRRTLALASPIYNEPSGPNRSIATLAAAYGLTYAEAAKRFAPPSVLAMGGGGLRGLMEYS